MNDVVDEGRTQPPARPLCDGGMAWRAHGLERDAGGEHVFRALPGYGALLGLAQAVGYGSLALGLLAGIVSGEFAAFAICAIVGGLFLGAVVLLRPRVQCGVRVRPSARVLEFPAGLSGREVVRIRFDDIAAVQYVPYRKHGTEPFRVIHGEIDVLLRSGRRLNVVNHNVLDRMRDDAEQLAQLIGVPLHVHPVYEPGVAAGERRAGSSSGRP